jgi:hypothetical protein
LFSTPALEQMPHFSYTVEFAGEFGRLGRVW